MPIYELRIKNFVILSSFAALMGASVVFGASIFDIQYPIAELGNCADQSSCKTYCNEPANADACTAFAKNLGVVREKEEKVIKAVSQEGPGGCQTPDECKTYCDDSAHAE